MKYLYTCSLILLIMSCQPTRQQSEGNIHFNWKMAGEIPDGGVGLAGPVAGCSDKVLIIAGGSNFPKGAPWDGGTKVFYKKIYLFRKDGKQYHPMEKKIDLPYKVAYSANCSTGQGVVVAGGQNKEGALKKVLLLQWNATKDQLMINPLPDLPVPLSSGAMACIGKNIYFAGGQNADIVSDKMYHLNLRHLQKGWDTTTLLPQPVTHTVLYAEKEALYLVGGRKRNPDSTSTLYKNTYKYELESHQWQPETPLPYAVSAHTGITLNDSTLLVFSGDQGKTFHQTEVLMAKIAQEKDRVKKQELISEKNNLQKNHPGFSGDVLAYHLHEKQWQKVDSIPFPGQVTTTAVKWGKKEVVIPGGEIRAGVRTANITLGKLK